MKRTVLATFALGLAALLFVTDDAQAQWRGRRSGWSAGVSTPYFYGSYSSGSPYYSSGYGYPYSTYYGWNRPYYGGYNYSYPSYSYYTYPSYTNSYPYSNNGNWIYDRSSAYFQPDQSFYSQYPSGSSEMASTGTDDRSVLVHVILPRPDARVWVEDALTQQGGADRHFVSPPLDPGKNYTYTIKASWMENGKDVTREQKIKVRAGQEATADFMHGGQTGAPSRLERTPREEETEPGLLPGETNTPIRKNDANKDKKEIK